MKGRQKIYNINTFNFYRRQFKPEDLERAFIKLIEKEEKKKYEEKFLSNKNKFNLEKNSFSKINNTFLKNSKRITLSSDNNKNILKNVNLNLIFPKISMERIMKIRDLFLDFDADKNRAFDKDEIYLMFNMNKIPITKKEVIDLFGFNNRKKYVNFFDFIQLTVNEQFSNKFKKLIMEKIKFRCSKNDICPIDFSEMLSHLCEFVKLSPELKDRTRELLLKNIAKNTKRGSKTVNNIGNERIRRNSIFSDFVKNLYENNKKDNFDFNNLKDINEIRENPNLSKQEKEFNNFMEISEKKFGRFKEYFKKTNIIDIILKRKEKVSNSLKIINNINPEIAKNYICYYPTDNIFKSQNDNKILSLSFFKDNKKYQNKQYMDTEEKERDLLDNKTKRNIYLRNNYNYKNNFMKLVKNKKLTNYSVNSKYKRKESKLKEKEYLSILSGLTLNYPYLSLNKQQLDNTGYNSVKNRTKYSENTFVTTGLYSKLNI